MSHRHRDDWGYDYTTREAYVASDTVAGPRENVLRSDAAGWWRVDGEHAAQWDELIEVPLEASACAN
jgi:hypothetical protein